MRAKLLAYNVPAPRLSKLRFVCMRLGAAVQEVPQEAQGQALSALLGFTEAGGSAPAPEAPFADEMLVMSGFSPAMVNSLLAGIRQARMKPFQLKAMVTPTNLTWSGVYLHEQLLLEHDAIKAGRTPAHEEATNDTTN